MSKFLFTLFLYCPIFVWVPLIVPTNYHDLDMKQQKKNLFHMRWHINNKVSNVNIDKWNSINLASINMLHKLNFLALEHLRPYKL